MLILIIRIKIYFYYTNWYPLWINNRTHRLYFWLSVAHPKILCSIERHVWTSFVQWDLLESQIKNAMVDPKSINARSGFFGRFCTYSNKNCFQPIPFLLRYKYKNGEWQNFHFTYCIIFDFPYKLL